MYEEVKRNHRFVDHTNKKYNKITLLYPLPPDKRRTLWWGVCECGKEKPFDSSHVSRGYTKSCGCIRKGRKQDKLPKVPGTRNIRDISGRTYGHLKVLSFAGGQSNKALWNCECVCGNLVQKTKPSLRNPTKNQSCGCKLKVNDKSFREDYTPSLRRVYGKYKRRAEDAGRDFTLSIEHFHVLTKQNCHYCDKEPSHVCNETKLTAD